MKKCHWCGVENETVQDVLYETDPLCDECFAVHYPLPDDYEEQLATVKSWRTNDATSTPRQESKER